MNCRALAFGAQSQAAYVVGGQVARTDQGGAPPPPPLQLSDLGAKPAECEANCAHHHPVRLNWAKLLRRMFDLDLEHCPNCGGGLKIIAPNEAWRCGLLDR